MSSIIIKLQYLIFFKIIIANHTHALSIIIAIVIAIKAAGTAANSSFAPSVQ